MEDLTIFDRIQPHTVRIYDLKSHQYEVKRVPARQLLTIDRFDLFAKLYYIEECEKGNKKRAFEIYNNHIKAFNPDLKEPGRDDKHSYNDFINAFDTLIETFRKEDFDDSVSLIPISESGTILDGAHRVAALAYFNREVTVVQFEGVFPKCDFNYKYFINRGLSWSIADTIAHTMVQWSHNIHVACLWPKMGVESKKKKAVEYLSRHYPLIFEKCVSVSLKSMMAFVSKVYEGQPWVTNPASVQYKALECFASNHEIHFVFFKGEGLEQVLADKDAIREIFHIGKHALHITDNDNETHVVANMVLTVAGMHEWHEENLLSSISERINECIYVFKKVHWISFKVWVANLIKSVRK